MSGTVPWDHGIILGGKALITGGSSFADPASFFTGICDDRSTCARESARPRRGRAVGRGELRWVVFVGSLAAVPGAAAKACIDANTCVPIQTQTTIIN